MTPGQISASVDGLRGIAAVFMVVNHVGVKLLDEPLQSGGLAGLAVFVGSAAPVLFFFLTGFGIGLRPEGAPAPAYASADKALALMVADLFLVWKGGHAWGLDFFGFIALSMVVVNLVSAHRRAVPIACALALTLLALRYGVAAEVAEWTEGWPWLAWVMGYPGNRSISYPLSPWLAYPLAGFVLARLGTAAEPSRQLLLAGLAVVAAVCLGGGVVAAAAGMPLHRWGTVNAPWFVVSVGVLAAAMAVAIALQYLVPKLLSAISLRGVAAFLVVPVHYLLIAWLDAALPRSLSLFEFFVTCAVFTAASIGASRLLFSGLVAAARGAGTSAMVVLLILAAGCGMYAARAADAALWATVAAAVGCLGVALWLSRSPSPRTQAITRPA